MIALEQQHLTLRGSPGDYQRQAVGIGAASNDESGEPVIGSLSKVEIWIVQ